MSTGAKAGIQVPCSFCPLRKQPAFRDFAPEELEFVHRFKKGELRVERGATVLAEGAASAHFYTVLAGWGFRYKLLADGRRQIVNYVVPGDLVGLQGTLMGEMQHSVEALSAMTLCVFDRERLFRLYEKHPSLAYDVTWIAAREECMLDENLLAVGRRSATERLAYLLSFLRDRARGTGFGVEGRIPITQQHVADTLGLSLVHTNRTVRKLVARKLIGWGEGGAAVLEPEALAELAHWDAGTRIPRPFI
ncbi:MAG: Crp/Fnr family transcriptional regulator [Rhizobiaceae bacterium]|nr:Crp/Fnr family transcriptional regulator [Rhizobiaceae bacterium]